jgi:signal transduction histidine kinase
MTPKEGGKKYDGSAPQEDRAGGEDRPRDQAQKLEAIGRLAGGIAHDFNNLLVVITGYSELALRRLAGGAEGEQFRNNFEEIKKAADRAAQLTRQLLAFSRRQVLQPKVLDLNELIYDISKMLRRLIGEDIELSVNLGSPLGHIRADPGQIEQVVMNLVVNARDAMPGGGKLDIGTRNAYLDDLYASQNAGVRPGHYVMLSVSDNGSGMDAETQAHIFEPFFTTKDVGKGTGLGLSSVYGIIKQSGGHIWVYSEPGLGTVFNVYLPRVDDPLGADENRNGSKEKLVGTETVLLVEDDQAVCEMTHRILEMGGYKVLVASRGSEALRIAEGYGGKIHLLLTDVVMPHLGGRELANTFMSMQPDIKILFMSGYTDDVIACSGVLDENQPFIAKPFNPDSLLRKVREVLDSENFTQRQVVDLSKSVGENTILACTAVGGLLGTRDTPSLEQLVENEDQTGIEARDDQTQQPIRILVIDDDAVTLYYLKNVLEDSGYIVSTALSGLQGIESAQEFYPDIILIDYDMPGMDGIQTIQSIRPVAPDASTILMTGYPDVEVITEALRQLVFDFLRKPFSSVELDQSLRRAIAYREARQRERRQRDFLSIISHQLRAPLQAPLSYIDNLLAGRYGPLSEEQRERMRRAEQGLYDEARLVNNLLDLNYLESGRFRANLSRGSVCDAIHGVIVSFDVQANDAGVSIIWDPPQDDFLIDFDVVHFKQALGNILDNALTHTPRGKTIKVRLRQRGDTVFCLVRDEGCGIRAIHLEHIFEKSYQAPSLISKNGLGIGLYIARHIVRAQGGDIAVRSRAGKGSTFIIKLPVGR